jgi:hypothetical protein
VTQQHTELGSSKRSARVVVSLYACVLASLSACTEPAPRSRVHVRIDADSSIQALIDDVQVVFETQYETGGGWIAATEPRRFEPKVRDGWPLEFTVDSRGSRINYQVTATARDDRDAVVVQARALRDWDAPDRDSIFLLFEASCVRREKLCPKGETCHAGACIGAHHEASRADKDSTPASEPMTIGDAGIDPGGATFGSEGDGCSPNGARACTGERSRSPLVCEDGSWRPAQTCSEDALCDTTKGAERGTCRQIADECRGQTPNVEFCYREEMRVCPTSFASELRTCGTNEHCVATTEARCECKPGFAKTPAGCERPTNCKEVNGGCDLLTTCTMRGSDRTCSDCPPGYVGSGETGCEPLLMGLVPSAGELSPPFDPALHSYRLKVGLLTQRVTLTPSAPSAERVESNGATVAPAQGWQTPTLPLGEFPVKLTLTSSSGAASDYDVVIERSGKQTAYVKASNPGAADDFGGSIAMSGDTLVVGAFAEDSAATMVDGQQNDNGAENSGAAYVFVKRNGRWEQQAYLKPRDAASGDFFGGRVAIEGDTIVIGALRTDALTLRWAATRPGAAYVFTRSGGKWRQTARLAGDATSGADLFGTGVAVSADTIAVGAPGDGPSGTVYVFKRNASDWPKQAKLKGEAASNGAAFGSTVVLDEDTLLVGAPSDDNPMNDVGSAYVFQRSETTWEPVQRLSANPLSPGASFGFSGALRGDRALIGAPREASINSLATTEAGEVFAFRRTGGSWTQTQVLKAILPRSTDSFGTSVALSDTAALVGGCSDASGAKGVGADPARRDSGYSGAGYLYAYENDEWTVSAYLKAANTNAYDSFGFSAALSDDTAVLGAIWEGSRTAGINGDDDDNSFDAAGAVYVFE